jgi:hypothetical protein
VPQVFGEDMSRQPQFKIEFHDLEREPQVPFRRAHSWGVDVPVPIGSEETLHCRVALPWPAPRCGLWLVACLECGCKVAATAAGRVDDPRSVPVPCRFEWRH